MYTFVQKLSIKKWAVLFSAMICCTSGFVRAEDDDQARGRLPDGRAFRTDVEGTQVVDYIAELEVSIEQLNRRVLGLEDEIKEKNQKIARLGAGHAGEPRLQEKTLLANEPEGIDDTARTVNCSAEVSAVRSELDRVRSDSEIERQVNQKRIDEFEATIRNLNATIDEFKNVVEAREASLKAVDEREAQARTQAQVEQSAVVSILKDDASIPSALPQEQRASLSVARLRAVESIRGRLLTDLNKLKRLIGTRDKNYQVYSQKRQVVTFKPSRLVAQSGRDVAAIQNGIESALAVSDLSMYGRDISDIEAKVQDDLALMQRVSRISR